MTTPTCDKYYRNQKKKKNQVDSPASSPSMLAGSFGRVPSRMQNVPKQGKPSVESSGSHVTLEPLPTVCGSVPAHSLQKFVARPCETGPFLSH